MSKISRTTILKRFGDSLRAKRLDANLSQEELAHRAGLDRTYVGGVERGERNISLVNMQKLSNALGIAMAGLLREIDP